MKSPVLDCQKPRDGTLLGAQLESLAAVGSRFECIDHWVRWLWFGRSGDRRTGREKKIEKFGVINLLNERESDILGSGCSSRHGSAGGDGNPGIRIEYSLRSEAKTK